MRVGPGPPTSTLQRTTSHTLYEASTLLTTHSFSLTIIWLNPARDISGWYCRRPLLYLLVSASGHFVHSFQRSPTGSLQSGPFTHEVCAPDVGSNCLLLYSHRRTFFDFKSGNPSPDDHSLLSVDLSTLLHHTVYRSHTRIQLRSHAFQQLLALTSPQ